ncbi:hypothetical protein LCGC14_1875010 [marine sediment metagenome]|uniref:Uncharacterized protein n=1 Tax=marine sediment metagenome TaxID=412755 RepID=A0A0F9IHW9_9ZZZZ
MLRELFRATISFFFVRLGFRRAVRLGYARGYDTAWSAFRDEKLPVCTHCGRPFDPWVVNKDVAYHTDLPVGSLVVDCCIACGYPDCD